MNDTHSALRTDPANLRGTEFLADGGAMGARIRAHDWSISPLRDPSTWSQTLRTLVGVMLGSVQPMFIAWGHERTLLYNDGYALILADRHPAGLGRPFFDVWPEVSVDLTPLFDRVFGGEPVHMSEISLMLDRRGRPEEAHFAFSYTPVRDEQGSITGLFCPCTETTEQVLAQRRYLAERERLQQLFEQAPGFMAMLRGPEHVFEFVNPAYMQLIGHRDVIGKSVREALPEVEGQGFFELLDTAYTTRNAFRGGAMRVGLQRVPGTAVEERFLDLVYQPVIDAEGRVTGIFAEGSDVTERVHAEAALVEREGRLRLVIEGAKDHAILTTDLQGLIITWSAGAQAIFGWSAEEAIGQSVSLIFTPEDRASEAHQHELAMAARQGFAADERWHVRKDGTRVFMNGSVHPLPRDAQGCEQGFIKIARDETERRRTHEALRRMNETLEQQVIERTAERNLLAKIVETTDAFIMVVGLGYDILAINKANADEFERIYGIRPKVGDNMLDLLADLPEHQAALRAGWGPALAGKEFTFVETFGDPARDRPYYEIKFNTLRDESGERIGAYQIVYDVTQRLRDQAQLAEAQDALRQAQKMEAVGQLTGGVAHDFNNLLTIIKSSTDLLRRLDLAPERRRRYVDAISDTVDRAAKLTGQLLAFARRQALKPEVFDVAERVRGVADMVRTIVGSRIRIATELAERCLVEADAGQFDTALINMAVNARDAMDGEGTLTVQVGSVAKMPPIRGHGGGPGRFVAVSLTDTGCGISRDDVGRIFEPFYTTKEVGKGTGLGLSQVFGFAKQSGGDVDVASEVGRGSSFTLYLPQVERVSCTGEIVMGSGGTGPGDDGRGRRVLVVEDNVEVGRFSTQLLQDLGYETTWAANAEEALTMLRNAPVDVVFSDVVMPGMGGVELAQEIRRRHPGLPVVLTSGYSHVLAQEGRHGFELLQKPYAVEDLSQVLRRVTRN